MAAPLFSKDFWIATGERVVSTLAFTLIGILSATGFDPRSADWGDIAVAVGVAGSLSLLKGIVANAATKTGPSLVNSEQIVPPVSAKAAVEQDEAQDEAAQRAIARRDDSDPV